MADLDLAAIKAKAGESNSVDFVWTTFNGVSWFDVVLALIARLEKAEAERLEQLDRFDRRYKNDVQVVSRWQAAHPGNDLVWPDRTDLTEWLLDRLTEADAVSEQFNGVVADRNSEIAHLRALLARAGEALEPFHLLAPGEARDWADDDGWTDHAPRNERICDWFGPTDFRTARTVSAEIKEVIGHE
jgi:hypothetical protein